MKKKKLTKENKSKFVVIGDIHACYEEFMELMEKLEKDYPFEEYVYVFLGDYVDHGPDANGVVTALMEYAKRYPQWVFLYGNHEDLMLDALGSGLVYQSYDLWWRQGGKETADSYFPADLDRYSRRISQPKDWIPPEHIDWLNSRPIYFDSKDYFFVHAGLRPDLSIEDHKRLLDEGDRDVRELMIWIRDQFIDDDKDWGKKIIFGHTAVPNPDPTRNFMPIVQKNKIGIDTAPNTLGGRLTALILPEEKFIYQEHLYNA